MTTRVASRGHCRPVSGAGRSLNAPGSVRVHPGDYVTLDTPLGAVGNSGNSGEPHLHVHAQRAGRIWDPFSGDPLPVRFDGRYLVRNDRVSVAARPAEIIDD